MESGEGVSEEGFASDACRVPYDARELDCLLFVCPKGGESKRNTKSEKKKKRCSFHC